MVPVVVVAQAQQDSMELTGKAEQAARGLVHLYPGLP
jgi:hypothetical protein